MGWRLRGTLPHVWRDVRRTLSREAVWLSALWISVLRVLEGQPVHVQRFSHVFDLVGSGLLNLQCLVERVNKVGERAALRMG